jgi:alginate O-acetyltransferase complex protein AlgJ
VRRPEAWILTVIFVALITVPLVIFAAGVRPEPNQNRPPTPLPEVNAAGVFDGELTPQLDAYLEDALFITPGAVAANALTDIALGDSPSDKVTLGTNNWLYYTFSLTRPCLTPDDVAEFADTVDRAERAVAAAGRKLVVAVAPDKATIIPDFLPPIETCVDEVADSLESLDEPQALVTVWDDMRKARADQRPIYFRLDTHWTNAGAGVMGEAIVNTLAADGWSDDAVRELGEVDHEGDLTVILGLPGTEPTEELEVVLPGTELTKEIRTLQTPTGEEVTSVVAVDFSVEGDAVVAGHTLVMHDSFGWALTPMIAPYFETSSVIAETDPEPGYMWPDLEAADTVVHVSVQRELFETILGRDLAAAFVAAYADSYSHTGGGALAAGAMVDVDRLAGSDRYVIVQLAEGSDGSEVSVGDRTVILTPDSPRTAFTIDGPATLTASGAAEYSFVSIER